MMSEEEFEEGEACNSAAGTKGVKYLSVKASIKEDLQAIFELQKEVGQAVWSLHKLIASLHAGAGATQSAFVQAHTDLAELIDRLSERQDSLQQKLEDLTELTEDHLSSVSEFHKEFGEYRKTLHGNWDRINVAIDTVLKANGVDLKTLAQPNQEILVELRDAKVRRERWVNAIIGGVVGLISTSILGLYARTVALDQAETHESTRVILKKIEEIADAVKKSQTTLNDHIEQEEKTVSRRNRQKFP